MKRTLGFTLIEILVALMIFSILMTIISSALFNVFTVQTRLRAHDLEFSRLQKALLIIERDCEQIINRGSQNQINLTDNGLEYRFNQGNPTLTFSRAGLIAPIGDKRNSQLQRVSYFIKDHQFIRRSWGSLDTKQNNQVYNQVLLEGVSELRWQFFDANHRQYDLWPPVQKMANELPQGLQMQFKLRSGGLINRTFLLPERTLAYPITPPA